MVEESLKKGPSPGRIGKTFFMVLSKAGPNRDLSKGSRQQAFWDDHAAFIDGLVDDGFITLGGPLEDEGGAVLVVRAESEDDVRRTLSHDPWYREGMLELMSVKCWTIFIDEGE